MKGPRQYLPSAQFFLIAFSILLSAGAVYAAEQFTKPRTQTASLAVAQQAEPTQNWQQVLHDAQAQSATYTMPPVPDQNAVQNLLTAAHSDNITASVGRSLLIGLSNAKAQGLGDDIPTQDKLIAGAAQQIAQDRGMPSYSVTSLQTVAATQDTLKAYGNAVMAAAALHSDASYYQTLLAVGYATDNHDSSKLAPLKTIGTAYGDMAKNLATIPVPQTLVPLHLQILNNFARIAQTYPDMQLLLEDPLKGLAALQLYGSLMDETGRVFTNIAQQLQSNGILFTKDEPGQAWSALLPS